MSDHTFERLHRPLNHDFSLEQEIALKHIQEINMNLHPDCCNTNEETDMSGITHTCRSCDTIIDDCELECWACETHRLQFEALEANPITDEQIESELEEGISNLQRVSAQMEAMHALPKPRFFIPN